MNSTEIKNLISALIKEYLTKEDRLNLAQDICKEYNAEAGTEYYITLPNFTPIRREMP